MAIQPKDPRMPLSLASLMQQADEFRSRARNESYENRRAAEAQYGPSRVYDLSGFQHARAQMSGWDPFFQAMSNAAGGQMPRMRQAPTRDTIGYMGSVGSNQMGIRNTMMAETPESLAAIDAATGGNPDAISPGELRLAPAPQFSTRPAPSTGIGVSKRNMGTTNSTAQTKLKVQGQRGGARVR